MNAQNQVAADMIAIWFAGKVKTQKQLREAISGLKNTTLFTGMTDKDVEEIARDNEMKQGVKMF